MFGNLLNTALKAIPSQTVELHRFKEKVRDPVFGDKPVYFDPEIIRGSWQAVDVQDVKELGLDTAKRYRRFYTSHNIKDVQRGLMPDLVVYDGKKYAVVGDADWYAQDGWKSLLCVEEER